MAFWDTAQPGRESKVSIRTPKPPRVVGYEVAGEVDAPGPGASGPALGTKVLGMICFGGRADLVCIPSSRLFPCRRG